MSIDLEVDIEGADKLFAGLGAAPAVLAAAATDAMTKSTLLLESEVKAGTPRVTGRLFASIHGEVRPAPFLQGRVSTSVRYAPWVEAGRGPISAKHLTRHGSPGFLRFRIGGLTIYRRSVGPAAGRFMFRRALIASGTAIQEFFHAAARRVAEAIAAGGS